MGNYINPIIFVKGGGGNTPTGKYVCFYDGFGELYDKIDVANLPLSELPTLPTLEGYTFNWNKTLQEINEMTNGGDVVCETTANSLTPTILYPVDLGWQGGTLKLYFQGADYANTLTIDWGDGNSDTLSISANQFEVLKSHSFNGRSTNPITITPESQNPFYLGSINSGGSKFCTLLGRDSSSSYSNLTQNGLIKKALLGDGARLNISSYNNVSSFAYCSALENVLIPKGATEIGSYSFYHCHSLRSVVLPSTITTTGDGVFTYCTSMKNAFVLGDITVIGYSMFAMNYCLEKVILPDTITLMHNFSFQYCESLREFKCPNSVQIIEMTSFAYCYALRDIVIPATCTSIGNNTFNYCYCLKNIYVYATTPPSLASGAIPYTEGDSVPAYIIYVPSESISDYQNASDWAVYTSKFRGI